MFDRPSIEGEVVPSPTLVAARLELGVLPLASVPLIAAHWLVTGYDGPALAQLAGLRGNDPNDVRDLLPETLAECNAAIPASIEGAAMTCYLAAARLIVDGEIAPIYGAARIWALAAEIDYSHFDEIRGLVAAASQWGEVPLHAREKLGSDALAYAQEFIARNG